MKTNKRLSELILILPPLTVKMKNYNEPQSEFSHDIIESKSIIF